MKFYKQDKMGVSAKEHMAGMAKYCSSCGMRKPIRAKEEKHTS